MRWRRGAVIVPGGGLVSTVTFQNQC
jgi:hypothetical protein